MRATVLLQACAILALNALQPAGGAFAQNATRFAAGAQGPGRETQRWTVRRTPDGQPDLQGVWDFRTITPLERPAALGDKEFLSDAEIAEIEAQKAEFEAADPKNRPQVAPVFNTARVIGDPVDEQAYNSFWFDTGTTVVPSKRTSLIVDPADGRIPYSPAGRERAARRRGVDNPEERGLTERCILSLNAGPPMRPSAYNNNVQIIQTPGYVVLVNEMIHDARIVPLDGRPHLFGRAAQWRGDSRGRWEGTTLVIETRRFDARTAVYGSTEDTLVVERLTPAGPDTIDYEFTVHDPRSFTRPWTAAFPFIRTHEPMYEYACHEANYGLAHILKGARAQETPGAAKP